MNNFRLDNFELVDEFQISVFVHLDAVQLLPNGCGAKKFRTKPVTRFYQCKTDCWHCLSSKFWEETDLNVANSGPTVLLRFSGL